MRVYVVRHGQSENNLKDLWTGWCDAALTEKGIADAKRAAELLREIRFDKVYSSDLQRARLTAENALPGYRYETTELLREVNVGNIANTPLTSITDEQREEAARVGYAAFDGETKEELNGRVKSVMRELESFDCENVALFCHAGWLRTMLDEVVGLVLPRKNIQCNNCAMGVFEYRDGSWSLFSWINL